MNLKQWIISEWQSKGCPEVYFGFHNVKKRLWEHKFCRKYFVPEVHNHIEHE